MVKKVLTRLIAFLLILTITTTNFASNVIIEGGMDSLFDFGPGFDTELIVCGDSYAQHFYNDEKDRGVKFYEYFHEGQTIEENWNILLDAFKSYHKLIFMSISVNDRHRKTHPSVFEGQFRELLDIAKETSKFVFLHSYMYYDLAYAPIYPYSVHEYDAMIRKLVQEYDNVYFIDMSDCVGSDYMLPDGIHYNKKFNDILFDRINFMINLIKVQHYGQ